MPNPDMAGYRLCWPQENRRGAQLQKNCNWHCLRSPSPASHFPFHHPFLILMNSRIPEEQLSQSSEHQGSCRASQMTHCSLFTRSHGKWPLRGVFSW